MLPIVMACSSSDSGRFSAFQLAIAAADWASPTYYGWKLPGATLRLPVMGFVDGIVATRCF